MEVSIGPEGHVGYSSSATHRLAYALAARSVSRVHSSKIYCRTSLYSVRIEQHC
jgi:hypothetical protein